MKRRCLSAVLTVLTACATVAAEEADTLKTIDMDELVIVATPKENKELRELPIASTKLTQQELRARQVTGIKSLTSLVPNLFIPDYGSRLTTAVYIRGIGSRINTPAVGLYVDNIPYIDKSAFDFNYADIEQVEVLRGPQSLLYGRNTMGGLVSIRTLSPLTYQGTRLIAEYGNKNSIKAGASHYSAFAENFGIGAGIYYTHTDGFFTNLYNGEKCDKENAVRAALKLEWIPKEGLTVMNSIDK